MNEAAGGSYNLSTDSISCTKVKFWQASTGLLLLILAITLFFTYTFLNREFGGKVVGSPDEDVSLFFARQIADNSSFTWHSDLNQEFGVAIFQPRLATDIGGNNYTGPYPQFELILALARIYGVLDYITGVLALLGVIGIYLLGREIAGNKAGLLSGFIYGFLPPLVLDANKFLSMVPAVSLAIFSIFCFLKAIMSRRGAYYFISAIFLGAAILIRADFTLLFLPYLVVLIVNRKTIIFKYVFIGVGIIAVLIIPWYLYFYRILPTVSTRPFSAPISAQILSVIQNIGAYPFSFLNYIVLNPLPLSILGLPALIWIIKSRKRAYFRNFTYLCITILIVYFIAYGQRTGTWDFWKVSSDSSMFRYFLLPYGMLALCFGILVTSRNWWGRQFSTSVIVLALILPLIAVFSSSQLTADEARLQWYTEIKSSVMALPDNAVLFTKSWDKIVGSGTRDMATYRTYEDAVKNPEINYFFHPVDVDKDLVPIVGKLLDQGRPVYVLGDDTDLAEGLEHYQYKLIPVPNVGYEVLQPGTS